MSFRAIRPDDFEWITRPHEPGEPARHVAEVSAAVGSTHVRGNVWRYEAGAKGKRHGIRSRKRRSSFSLER